MNLSGLAQIEVLTPQGKPVFFGELWRERPAVLAFVRHFGCLFCFEQVADMVSVAPAIEAAGARLCFIGNGNPLHAQVFMDETGLTSDVYTDPARLLYKRLSMKHGLFSTVNRTSRRYARRAGERGFRQIGVRGDPWQQGGVLAVTREGVVAYLQRFSVAGERVDLADIEQAARRLTATG
jgi:peroxiredoxin